MHQDFDRALPRHEQLARLSAGKTPGRKHQHRKGPGKAANEAANKKRNVAAFKKNAAAPFVAAVRAYWLGLRDSYPTKGGVCE